MNILDRIFSMVGLDRSASNLSDAYRRRDIGLEEADRTALHGDLVETTANAHALAKELDRRTKSLG